MLLGDDRFLDTRLWDMVRQFSTFTDTFFIGVRCKETCQLANLLIVYRLLALSKKKLDIQYDNPALMFSMFEQIETLARKWGKPNGNTYAKAPIVSVSLEKDGYYINGRKMSFESQPLFISTPTILPDCSRYLFAVIADKSVSNFLSETLLCNDFFESGLHNLVRQFSTLAGSPFIWKQYKETCQLANLLIVYRLLTSSKEALGIEKNVSDLLIRVSDKIDVLVSEWKNNNITSSNTNLLRSQPTCVNVILWLQGVEKSSGENRASSHCYH